MLTKEERGATAPESFKTKEEWEAHKADLARMSRFFEKVAGQIERGERATTSTVSAQALIDRHVQKGRD